MELIYPITSPIAFVVGIGGVLSALPWSPSDARHGLKPRAG